MDNGLTMARMQAAGAAFLIAALLTSAAVGAAETTAPAPSAEDEKKADAIFREGVNFLKQERWAEAEAKFLAAWALNPSYDVANNLGHTQYRLGKYRDASEHLSYALRNWPIIGKKEPRDLAQQRLAEMRKEIGVVTVTVNVPGAMVFVEGKAVGRAPIEYELFVEPGRRVVEAKLEGYKDARQEIEAAKGGTQRVTLELTANAKVAGPVGTGGPRGVVGQEQLPKKKEEGLAGTKKVVVIAGGATAGAALVTGVVFAVLANQRASAARDKAHELIAAGGPQACAQPLAACEQTADLLRDWTAFKNGALWSFVGAGAFGIATGIYALAAPNPQKAGVRATPVVTAQGAGVVLSGAW